MRKDIYSVGVTNPQHYETMREFYEKYGIILDPHGAVALKGLQAYRCGKDDQLAVIYETAPDFKEKFPFLSFH